ncbi:hypothetical protein F0562_020570 [Nyssa sinensis]|uniref:RRM domain-containing protein n=1 Tax=Nyssa sinensis TaxID=561372 RepID=A0A5J5BST7_9ASTE|nr:hypothetical protein F0562_020570 [Nyssa sinensis]
MKNDWYWPAFLTRAFSELSMASADVEFRCFVGGLAWATDDQALERAFSQFGDIIDSKIINDRETGRSRGFGFVTFKDEQVDEGRHRGDERSESRRTQHHRQRGPVTWKRWRRWRRIWRRRWRIWWWTGTWLRRRVPLLLEKWRWI